MAAGNAVYHHNALPNHQEVNRQGRQGTPKDFDMSKCRPGAVVGRRSEVGHDLNHGLWRQITSRWPGPSARECVIAHLDGNRSAEEMNPAVAVIRRRLRMARDESHRTGIVAAGYLVSVTEMGLGSDRAMLSRLL